MSVEAQNAVWTQSKSTGRARLLLLAIANYQGENGAWPSLELLAERVNASKRSVQRDIQRLVELGELIVKERSAPFGGQYRANLYWVNVGVFSDMTDWVSDTTELTSDMTDSASDMTPVGTLTNKNYKNIKKLKQEEQFAEFWNHYPKKPGRQERKQDALKAFRSALTRATFEDIMAGVEAYKTRHNGFPMLAHNWLKNDGWEDAATSKQKSIWDWEVTK